AEEELRESEARYRALVELSPDAVYVHQNGRIIFANASTISLLAASGVNDIVGNLVLGFVAPEDRTRVQGRISHTLTTGQAAPLAEFKMIRLDGVLVDVAVAGRAIEWKGGSAVLVVARDVSEQKAKEQEIRMLNEDLERRVEERTEELRESEARIRAIIECAPVNIAVKDIDGRHILVGPQSKDLFGVAWDEILGKAPHDLVPEIVSKELADSLVAHDRVVLKSGQASEQEDEVLLEDGIHTILTVKFPIPDAVGGCAGIGAISSDITERKRLERELLRQERLATLGQLTATVSHELRNPLGVIRTSIFVMREGLNGEAPRVKRSLERIERSVIRCDRIIDELLGFTRISEI
ncbi:PAS domain S-box protein, partial [bacterium]|nr:PAS domain S-box protein [bacterium]